MRKVGLLLVLAGASSVAQADSKADVEKLVRTHLAATVGKQGAFDATLSPDDHEGLIGADGFFLSLFADCEMDPKGSSCDSDVPLFGTSWFGELKYSNVKPTIHVDDAKHVATFFVTADLAGHLSTEGMEVKGKTRMHITGIARLEKAGWRVAAAKYSSSLPDSALFKYGEAFHDHQAGPKPGVEAEVASWLGHLADHQSADPLAVNGTAPNEVATDKAGISKLVKSWDKLDLKPTSYYSDELGDTALVWMDVTLTVKKKPVDLTMVLVVRKEGDAWKWVAINFGTMMLTDHSFL